jgi:hypothetical protein
MVENKKLNRIMAVLFTLYFGIPLLAMIGAFIGSL